MALYKCQNCGVKIADKAMLKQITELEERGLITTETWRKAKKRIERGAVDPHIGCHNCDGLMMLQR